LHVSLFSIIPVTAALDTAGSEPVYP